MADHETHIVETGGGAGAIAAIVIVAALIIGFLVLFDGRGGGGTLDVDVPAVSVDVQPDGQ